MSEAIIKRRSGTKDMTEGNIYSLMVSFALPKNGSEPGI